MLKSKENLVVKASIAVVIGLLLTLMAACGQQTGSPGGAGTGGATAPSSGGATGQPAGSAEVTLNYVTYAPGSGPYGIAVGHADVVGKNSYLKLVVQPSKSSTVPRLVAAGEGDLGITTSVVFYEAYNGAGEFTGDQLDGLRLLQVGSDNYFGVITSDKTGIKTVPDLKGHKYTHIPSTRECVLLTELILGAYGLDPDNDVVSLKAESPSSAFQDLAEGRTEATAAGLLGSKVQELATKVTPVVLPVEPAKRAEIMKECPAFTPIETPEGQPYPAGIPVLNSPDTVFAREDFDETLAYDLVKTIVEHDNELSEVLPPTLRGWSKERAVQKVGVPYHPGAIKYYREIGIWNDEMEQYQQQVLAQGK